jgi:hypothetical protein
MIGDRLVDGRQQEQACVRRITYVRSEHGLRNFREEVGRRLLQIRGGVVGRPTQRRFDRLRARSRGIARRVVRTARLPTTSSYPEPDEGARDGMAPPNLTRVDAERRAALLEVSGYYGSRTVLSRSACREHGDGHRVISFKVCWILKMPRWPRR